MFAKRFAAANHVRLQHPHRGDVSDFQPVRSTDNPETALPSCLGELEQPGGRKLGELESLADLHEALLRNETTAVGFDREVEDLRFQTKTAPKEIRSTIPVHIPHDGRELLNSPPALRAEELAALGLRYRAE